MSSTAEMLTTHPNNAGVDTSLLAATIEALNDCATTCTTCADACLSEDSVADLRACIRSDQDCADICATTAQVLARFTGDNAVVVKQQLTTCITACSSCAEECEAHADHHEHCRVCAEACRRCEKACAELLGALP